MDINIEFLPKGVCDPLFEQRESGRAHTPYEAEVGFYRCIQNGDAESVKKYMSEFLHSALVVGRMSNDNLRQARYFAVSCITLATRYAIEGGLDESVAYNLSDGYIMYVDSLNAEEQIVSFLTEKAVELAVLVSGAKGALSYPPHVRRAIKYIDAHLHEKLTVRSVADNCGISADYLSLQFKKHKGQSLSGYIADKKLEAAAELLKNGKKYTCGEIAYIYGFCSETYFIGCFKRKYGITPKRYAAINAFLI